MTHPIEFGIFLWVEHLLVCYPFEPKDGKLFQNPVRVQYFLFAVAEGKLDLVVMKCVGFQYLTPLFVNSVLSGCIWHNDLCREKKRCGQHIFSLWRELSHILFSIYKTLIRTQPICIWMHVGIRCLESLFDLGDS